MLPSGSHLSSNKPMDSDRGTRCAASPARHWRRVCRTWHRTSGVQVPVPSVRAAEGEEKGKGVTARWGPEEAQSKDAGRRTGTGYEVWDHPGRAGT